MNLEQLAKLLKGFPSQNPWFVSDQRQPWRCKVCAL